MGDRDITPLLPRAWQDAIDDYATGLSVQGAGRTLLTPESQAGYVSDVRRVAQWLADHGMNDPARVTPSALALALKELGWAPATRARALIALRRFWSERPRFDNPAALIDAPRVTPPPVPSLSQDDAARLVEAMGRMPESPSPTTRALALRDRALGEVLYGSGLRRGEACALTLGGLRLAQAEIEVIGKGGARRTVPVTAPAATALAAWLDDGRPLLARQARGADPVFVSRSGRPLDGSSVYRIVHRALGEIGRSGGPHLLRHATGTHLLEGPGGEGGAHLRVVQEVLGHKSIATTQRYTHVSTRQLQKTLRQAHPRGEA